MSTLTKLEETHVLVESLFSNILAEILSPLRTELLNITSEQRSIKVEVEPSSESEQFLLFALFRLQDFWLWFTFT